MPIVHEKQPFGTGENNQFEVYCDGETVSREEMEKILPEDKVDLRVPIHDENDTDYDLQTVVADEKNKRLRADVSQFKLLKVLGQGSFGKVYMVLKIDGTDKDQFFAMKVLKKATLKVRDRIRTKMERDILANIQHPFVVNLHYAFQTEGKLYLVLDLVRGGDLFSRLTREVMFTEEDAKFYLAELALALGHLHKCGIIYRDLKPENILLEIDGHIKLTDFGLCKESVYDDGKTYSFCGTIEYMAPEVITRRGHGPAADWWSYGVLTYEMLTGTLPFHSSNRRETMAQIINAKLGMPNMLSSGAQKLLRALFKRVPDNRLGSKEGTNEFIAQPFFKSIDFEKLYRKEINPPFIPTVPKNDAALYNHPGSKSIAESPSAVKEHMQLFKGFSYIAPLDDADGAATNVASDKRDVLSGFLPVRTNNVKEDYDIFEEVGRGSFSVVHRAINKANKQTYAVKIVLKSRRNVTEEVEILLRYSEHPNIATLRDVYQDNEAYYLILEYLRGGELLDRINKSKGFSEREVASYMEKLFKTIMYLHEHNVVHRDLQPSNIMFADESYKSESIRITDFGFSKQIKTDNGLLMTPCFTANFVAPEVLMKQGYDQSCDIWSLGVILFAMLSGTTPFVNNPQDAPSVILNRISTGALDMTSGVWPKVSESAKNLIHGMLNLDPTKRLSAAQLCQHSWIVKKEELSSSRLTNDPQKLKNAMKAMFTALQKNNDVKPLSAVTSSSLMQKRANKKG